ncbi:MAG TPA: class II aldolase/adducin family protein, partial [Bacteroidota bacterium]
METRKQVRERDLLLLSHRLGSPELGMAILGEGNVSARIGSGETFMIKASGASLGTLKKTELVVCKSGALLPLLESTAVSDEEVEAALLASRVKSRDKKPSVEALFHAYCLSLKGIEFVGHTHAISVNQILCSTRAGEFAEKRIFPDEIVCCGRASVFVPYTDPGLRLAKEIRQRVEVFLKRFGESPRVILVENHGIIAMGRSAQAVLAAMLMAEKTA